MLHSEPQALIEKDCRQKGRGRKKWWAESLGVHPQTISYWLHGQRRPSGKHIDGIRAVASILGPGQESDVWYEHLLKLYFSRIELDPAVAKEIIRNILQAETLGVRALAFTSLIVEELGIGHIEEPKTLLRNRIGWLLEVSGERPAFPPIKCSTMPLVKTFGKPGDPLRTDYLKTIQTETGRRWQLYDCDLTSVKRSFVGNYFRSNPGVPKSPR